MNRPLVFYSISLYLSLFCATMLLNNIILGAVLAASFLAIMYFTTDKKIFIIITIFFFFGIVNYQIYFNVHIPESAWIRVTAEKNYYFFGDYKGRKIFLKGLKKAEVKEGEKILVKGKFKAEKDYVRGITGSYSCYEVIKKKEDLVYNIYAYKKDLYNKFNKYLGEEAAAETMSLCFGDTKYLSNTQKKNFQMLGVIHAISVSGFHMALIYKVLEGFIGVRGALVASLIYVIFTGSGAATLRSFIMIFIYKLGKLSFKNYDAISSLALSAILILSIKPCLYCDLGFILSFLATLGLILFYKKLERIFYRLPDSLNQGLSMMLSAQVLTLPYIAFTIKSFNMGFILGNLILSFQFSIIVVLGNLTAPFVYLDKIFLLLCYVLKTIMTALNGAYSILLSITPDNLNLGYLDGIGMIAVFLSFLLFYKGYKKFKYMPLAIIIYIVASYYSFIPSVQAFNVAGDKFFILEKGYDKILICDKTLHENVYFIEKLKADFKITKIISDCKSEYSVNFSNKLVRPQFKKDDSLECIYLYNNEEYKTLNVEEVASYKKNTKEYKNNYNDMESVRENLYVIIFNKVIKIF